MKATILTLALAAIALVSCKQKTEEVSGEADQVKEGVSQVIEAAAEPAPTEPAPTEPSVDEPAAVAPATEAPATEAPATEAPATEAPAQ
ncbi:MAG: hypothetical protein RL346_282 [Verrucomicrobiota bacterium]|jgi:hypothetical protein